MPAMQPALEMNPQSVLNAEIAEKAIGVIFRIARSLTDAAERLGPEAPEWHGGTPGEFALFFGCAGAVEGKYKDLSAKLAELAVEVYHPGTGLGLHGGLSGLAWKLQLLSRPPLNVKIDAEAICTQTDELLLGQLLELQQSKRWFDYDVISGLAGYGIYLLSRERSKKACQALKLIIGRLEQSAEEMPKGIAWHTPARTLPTHQRRVAPRGYYNLGVAHGIPGVIGFLAGCYERGIERRRALTLLRGAVEYVLSQKLPPNPISILPAWVVPGRQSTPCRVAWCYGDLGVSVVLLDAARKVRRADWEEEAIQLGRQAAKCPFEKSGTLDACLCHGAAGNGHLFHRLFQATGDKTFLRAARGYFAQALRIRGTGKKVAGYSFWTGNRSPKLAWGLDASFLSGITGVGLAFLSVTGLCSSDWDGLLLPGKSFSRQ
jgi:lantibiotic biosynthesis protein